MGLRISLLGRPSATVDGDPVSLRGRKSWALLTYLVTTRTPQSRKHLAELLFADADDPLRALRWNLTELRRALGADVGGDPVILALPGAEIDVDVLRDGATEEAMSLGGLGHPLLEGIDLGSNAIFETWLLVQKRQVQAATVAVMREGVLSALAAGRYDVAIGRAASLVAVDPLDEESQALLIRSYAASGDHRSAARQLEACTTLLRRELGVEPGPAVTSAISVSPASATGAAVGGTAAARAQLEAGTAAVTAGAYDAGIECLRRATSEAHASGDVGLKAETLLALGSALVHSGRPLRVEGAAALFEAIRTAQLSDNIDVERRASFELAWNDFLDARYSRAERWLDRAEHDSDIDLTASALWVRGKIALEVGNYSQSISFLQAAVDAAERAGDQFRTGFALASLGRTYMLREENQSARAVLRRSLDVVRANAPVLVPVSEGFLASVCLNDGDMASALELAEHAYAYAIQVGDISMIGIAARPLAIARAESGRADDAIVILRDVQNRFQRVPDHTWTLAYVLDALCSIARRAGVADAERYVEDLDEVVRQGPMNEMIVRALLHRAAMGDEAARATAVALAREIDNPALHRLVYDISGADVS